MTRTVADSALMLTVMNEPDARDWYAVPGDGADLRRACTASVKGWRIAYSPLLGNRSVHPEVAALVKAAPEALVDLGAIDEEIESPLAASHETFRKHWFTGAAKVFTTLGADPQGLIDPGMRRKLRQPSGRAEMCRDCAFL